MADVTYFFDVIGAQALLHIRQSPPTGMALTQQVRHKRLHPCANKQRGRVVFWHQRKRGDNGVPTLRKEAQE